MRRLPHVSAQRGARPAFTLVEVLVATGLVGLVLGLALNGFIEAKKISDLTRSKVQASDEAQLGLNKMAKIIRRCHIVFFNGRPLDNDASNAAGGSHNGIAVAATGESSYVPGTTVPNHLTQDPDGDTVSVRWNPGSFAYNNTVGTRTRDSFRFAAAGLLKSNDTTIAPATDRNFTNPLFYGAEATFNTNEPGVGTLADPTAPVSWNFYVFYLAPMSFTPGPDDGHALFPNFGGGGPLAARDRGRAATGGGTFARSTVPYEIRMLMIPDVLALTVAQTNTTSAVSPFITLGRILKGSADAVRQFPYDATNGTVNYDPWPLAIDRVDDLKANLNSWPYLPLASGPRVNGSAHGNFMNIGNDPPTNAAMDAANRRGWDGANGLIAAREITDTVVCRYVDPDAANGTYVRLGVDRDWEGLGQTRPYVPAYSPIQSYRTKLRLPAGGTVNQELRSPPKRAAIAVTTRFRTTRQIPFQFSTEIVEVDLEALQRYQQAER